MPRAYTIAALILLSTISSRAQQADQAFNAEEFASEVQTLLAGAQEPGAYKGRIALRFADLYNKTAREHPDAQAEIERIAIEKAQEYGLTYELSDRIITTAKFIQPHQENKIERPTEMITEDVAPVPEEASASKKQKIVMPRFPGCEDLEGDDDDKYACAQPLLLGYIYGMLSYPPEARTKRIEGRCVVQFTVTEQGEITDITITQGLGHGIDEEALRIVESMNTMPERWTPGRKGDELTRITFTLPISFKLTR